MNELPTKPGDRQLLLFPQAVKTGVAPADKSYWDFCPNCSQRLENRGCKYRCPRCHYFMSCSDFD